MVEAKRRPPDYEQPERHPAGMRELFGFLAPLRGAYFSKIAIRWSTLRFDHRLLSGKPCGLEMRIITFEARPAERNVFGAMNMRFPTFRSYGARRIFLNLCSIDISSLRDEELYRTSNVITNLVRKQELEALLRSAAAAAINNTLAP
ncbi:MAG: hypothetical protein LC674_01015 [Actinobacteria bacterium]|nr:hypothetical protein [Actinomycetota bacterium]